MTIINITIITAGYAEASLKFWDEVDATTKQGRHVPYALNTRVDEPHR
jgi:hypothetical protein